MRTDAALPPAAAAAEALSPDDEAMLDGLQRAAFDYFVQHGRRSNGLVADTSRSGSHASIAVIGRLPAVQGLDLENAGVAYDIESGIRSTTSCAPPTHASSRPAMSAWNTHSRTRQRPRPASSCAMRSTAAASD